MNLNQIRSQIDKIDDEILSLILKRIEYSKIIAKIKFTKKISIYDENREFEIFKKIKLKSKDKYNYVFKIFIEILNSSKKIQKDIIQKLK